MVGEEKKRKPCLHDQIHHLNVTVYDDVANLAKMLAHSIVALASQLAKKLTSPRKAGRRTVEFFCMFWTKLTFDLVTIYVNVYYFVSICDRSRVRGTSSER